jgi:hypothetical protein
MKNDDVPDLSVMRSRRATSGAACSRSPLVGEPARRSARGEE